MYSLRLADDDACSPDATFQADKVPGDAYWHFCNDYDAIFEEHVDCVRSPLLIDSRTLTPPLKFMSHTL